MPDFKKFNQESYSEKTRVERLKVKRVRKTRLFLTTLCLLTILGSLTYATYVYAEDFWTYVSDRFFSSQNSVIGSELPGESEPRWLNILLLGVDQRKNEPARSDTLMVAMLNLKDKKVQVMSIPRDTRVKIEGLKNRTRINHAHSNGGVELTQKTVEQLLGVPIHNFVETNFDGFENIIDVIGGVNLDVEKRMYYPAEDINLRKGSRKLDGHDALSYVRYRSDGKGDLPRIERQHKFLKALVDEILQAKTILKLPKIAGELHRNLNTDMSIRDMLLVAGEFKSISAEAVKFVNVPGEPEYVNGASYYIVDEEKLQKYIEKILNGEDPEEEPEDVQDNLPGREQTE